MHKIFGVLFASYKLDVQAWQIRSADHKEYFAKRKHEIQKVGINWVLKSIIVCPVIHLIFE